MLATITLVFAAATPAQDHLPPEVAHALEQWRAQHGPAWGLVLDQRTDTGRMLFGGGAAAPIVPRSAADGVLLARHFIQEAYGLLRVDESTLIDPVATILPLAAVGTSDKVVVRFDQEVAGVPVVDGSVHVLFELRTATLLAIDSKAVPEPLTRTAAPTVTAEAASALVRARFRADESLGADELSTPTLVLRPEVVAGRLTPTLAWELVASVRAPGRGLVSVRYALDAGRGTLLAREDLVFRAAPQDTQISGTALGLATVDGAPAPGQPWPGDDGSNAVLVPLAHATVTPRNGAPVITSSRGDFTLLPPASTLVTVVLRGPFVAVRSLNSADDVSLEASLGAASTLIVNPSASALSVAQVNAFHRVTQTRAWIRATNPFDRTMESASLQEPAQPFRLTVNETQTCNIGTPDGILELEEPFCGCRNSKRRSGASVRESTTSLPTH
jgi:hypothetical protein